MPGSRDDWRPTAKRAGLEARARVLAAIRAFFAARGVLEVETPLLSAATVSDPHIATLSCRFEGPGAGAGVRLYLQTSPESAMKRLLAAGSGPIYQLARAFRDGEAGRLHNPEFTILEWYRPGFDHHRLMTEVEDLLTEVLGTGPGERLTFAQAFQRRLGVDPFTTGGADLLDCAASHGLGPVPGLGPDDRDTILNLLLSRLVEPHLGRGRPTFIHDFPASQAALARIRPGDPPLAERFEVYVEGVELANGYHELADPDEQRRRYERDLVLRRQMGLDPVPRDDRLLAALAHGLPDCAGVALGVDRLVMLAAGASDIADVLAFPVSRA
jgi:lysyl-tRNA synthetase class 2